MKPASIRTRLTAAALIFIIGTSVAMGVVGITFTSKFVSSRFHESFELIAANTARNAELGVLLEDRAMLDRLVRNLLEQDDIQAVSILNEQNQVLAAGSRDDRAGRMKSVESLIMSVQMEEESLIPFGDDLFKVIGRVRITYSDKNLTRLFEFMATRFILIALALSVMPVVMYWLVAKSLTAPLNDLLKVARDVSTGRMDVRASGGKLLETQTLAGAFNNMLAVLKHQQERLEEYHAEMSRQQTLAEVGKFSMMVAHEVKNPLTIIKGSLDLLKKKLEPETKKTMLLYLEEEVDRINRLMEDFLMFARPFKPAFTSMDINRFVRQTAEKIDLAGLKDGQSIELAVEDRPCSLPCDPNLMERALSNILRNAFDTGGANQPVKVTTCTNGNYWRLTVEDNGPGVTQENLSRIFEPFFTTKAKGTGLGLAMVREIVEAHHGEIFARNRPEGGACFEIRLPRLEVEGTSEQ